jgi:glycosyltransferase involved in cell wall biosynthesis
MVRKTVKSYDIDIIHHITYNEYRTPGKMYTIDIPFVWGPLGGGHVYKKELRHAHYRIKDIFLEIIRKVINYGVVYFSSDLEKAVKTAKSIIIADPETFKMMPKSRKYTRLLEKAYYPERNAIKIYDKKPNQSTILLLYAGELILRKGVKLLIEALGESNFRDFHLDIISQGKDKELLKKSVKKYQLGRQVEFLGKLSYDEVNARYDNADLFLFSSLRDTSGNVVLEAMSHGVPVITLNHNGVSEIVTPETGELIEIISYDQIKSDFVDAIKKYYFDRALLEKKGRLARNRIEKVYSWGHDSYK